MHADRALSRRGSNAYASGRAKCVQDLTDVPRDRWWFRPAERFCRCAARGAGAWQAAPAAKRVRQLLIRICTPASQAQEVGLALGAQAGESRLADVIKEGGFASVRRAAETPFNLILEARP